MPDIPNRLDVKHPKNVQAWEALDEEMKNRLKEGADLFVENVYPIIKKLSEE